jgi:hypothetical protein
MADATSARPLNGPLEYVLANMAACSRVWGTRKAGPGGGDKVTGCHCAA